VTINQLREKLEYAEAARLAIDQAEREGWGSTALDQAFNRYAERVCEAAAVHCAVMGQPGYDKHVAKRHMPYPLLVTAEAWMRRGLARLEEGSSANN
jgi:hypothetical protein